MEKRRKNGKSYRGADVYHPREMRLGETDEDLTATGGLGPILDLFLDSPLFPEFCECLPQRMSNASYDTEAFGLILMCGFFVGYDCLDDLEYFQNNPLITERFGRVPTPKAFGDWLRDFEAEHLEKLKLFLRRHAQFSRKQINGKAALVIDMDSTSHIQHGIQMEGLDYDFKGNWCLSSLSCSDELGFSHGLELRSGNTFSSVGSAGMIREVLGHLKHEEDKFFRADSAFCNQETLEQCVRMGAKFTITAHGNMGWEQKIHSITEWRPWEWSKEELENFVERKRTPPILEVGSFLYQPGWSELLRFYVVVKRNWKYDSELKQERWYSYAVITNFDLFKNSLQSVMEFHHRRGSAENVIREHKYNFDLKHFPCKKLAANYAYGLLGFIAHNPDLKIDVIKNQKI